MRATLSPAFTGNYFDNKITSKFRWQQLNNLIQIAGSKMRQMFELVSSVGQQVAKTIKKRIENGGESTYEFKDLARRFTVDVSLADWKKEKTLDIQFFATIRQSQRAPSELKPTASRTRTTTSIALHWKPQTSEPSVLWLNSSATSPCRK